MATKGNIRSMRFSDQMIEMIDQQVGDTFTARFEALVTRCMWELPRKEKQLEQIRENINQELQRLHNLQEMTDKLRQLARDIQSAQTYIGIVEHRAKAIAEAAEKADQ